MIIAVDGPSGAGKSTVARLLAGKLGFLYIDTGAMYRAIAFKALEEKADVHNESAISGIARNSAIELLNSPQGTKVLLDGKDISQEIRHPRITACVSDVAKIKGVREVLVGMQRQLGERSNSVLDGRDIGTTVFPNAEVKFYIDASFDERVLRRYRELQSRRDVSKESVAADLKNRDTIDSTRKISPLRKAPDAIYIDTSDMNIEQVVAAMLEHVRKKKAKNNG